MSKIKSGGLDQYGAEPFEQLHFGTAGIEGVKTESVAVGLKLTCTGDILLAVTVIVLVVPLTRHVLACTDVLRVSFVPCSESFRVAFEHISMLCSSRISWLHIYA